MVGNGLVFPDLLLADPFEGLVAVLERHCNVDDDQALGGLVHDDHVRPQDGVRARDLAVRRDSARYGRHCFCESMDNGVMTQLAGHRVLAAAAQHVWEGLVGMATATAALVPFTKATGSIQGDAIQAGTVQEAPVSEPSVGARPHHVV